MTNEELCQFLVLMQKLQWTEYSGKYQESSFESFAHVREAALGEIESNCSNLANAPKENPTMKESEQ